MKSEEVAPLVTNLVAVMTPAEAVIAVPTFKSPLTSKVASGFVVPIPTLLRR